jgi:hypothetical protein
MINLEMEVGVAPKRLYELPHEQLTRLLLEAKIEGLSFDEAWERAIRPGKRTILSNTPDPPAGAVRWPSDSSDRAGWQVAIYGVRDGFRRAYQDRPPTRRELAVLKVTLLLSAADHRPAARGIEMAPAVRSAA